jgi:uracil-DNA glycosylase
VVILGQDPYHGENQATGRAFEVSTSSPLPPSLVNIRKMLERDLDVTTGSQFQIGCWARQGVLLLNTTLSVRAGEPESHKNIGWQSVTDRLISVVAASERPTVFLLWGAHAQKKSALMNDPKNLILTAPHPSPLSAYRGFFDCRHFSTTNQWLTLQGESAIQWECAC